MSFACRSRSKRIIREFQHEFTILQARPCWSGYSPLIIYVEPAAPDPGEKPAGFSRNPFRPRPAGFPQWITGIPLGSKFKGWQREEDDPARQMERVDRTRTIVPHLNNKDSLSRSPGTINPLPPRVPANRTPRNFPK